MIANRDLLKQLREARKSMTPERAEQCLAVERKYVDACQLSCGPDPKRSAYWESRAAEEKITLYGYLKPADRPEGEPVDPLENQTETVGAGHSWY